MRILAWVRASQAILFEASIVPACVGTAIAVAAGSSFVPLYFALILASLLGIQAGANLLKGYYEALDGAVPPSSPGSWIAFDSGAAVGLSKEPKNMLRAAWSCMAAGVIAGLLLVAFTQSLLLLAFGLAGFALAWSYSSPPLKLSYRGLGEFSTFVSFGPIMTVGATVSFGTRGIGLSVLESIVMGLLAAGISFSRYFPNESEDRAKGKRTPVTILGSRKASGGFMVMIGASMSLAVLGLALDERLVFALAGLPFVLLAGLTLNRAVHDRARFETAIALMVLGHIGAGIGLVLGVLLQ
jgi:1,4-dihydroxy-2-naphthoate octaprenyltransferase